MVQRCTNPKEPMYSYYGGRGITVCERWRSFILFLADMGERPSIKYTLERIANAQGVRPLRQLSLGYPQRASPESKESRATIHPAS